MTAVERKAVRQAAVLGDSKRLELVELSVFGLIVQLLFDSRAVPVVTVASLYSQLLLQPHSINRRIMMADVSMATVRGEVGEVTITIGGITYALISLVVNYAPFSCSSEVLHWKLCRGCWFWQRYCNFPSGEQVVIAVDGQRIEWSISEWRVHFWRKRRDWWSQ